MAKGKKKRKSAGDAVHAEVVNVPAFSVHADQAEILAWLKRAPRTPRTTFVVHGETNAAGVLHDLIEQELGWTAVVPATSSKSVWTEVPG